MISNGRWIRNGEQDLRLPSDKELRIISTEHAKLMFGRSADRLDGMTVRPDVHVFMRLVLTRFVAIQWFTNDPSQL